MSSRHSKSKGVVLSYHSFSVPKPGKTETENEDRISPSASYKFRKIKRGHTKYFGISDGASASIDAGGFAESLLDYFRKYQFKVFDKMPVLSQVWRSTVEHTIMTNYPDDPDSQMELMKAVESIGGAATIVLLKINASGSFNAAALGDSVLFHVRRKKAIINQCPKIKEFNNMPPLIRSVEEPYFKATELKVVEGNVLPGDTFYLCTDALAEFIVKSADPVGTLGEIGSFTEDEARDFLRAKMENGELKSDDWSCSIIKVEAV